MRAGGAVADLQQRGFNATVDAINGVGKAVYRFLAGDGSPSLSAGFEAGIREREAIAADLRGDKSSGSTGDAATAYASGLREYQAAMPVVAQLATEVVFFTVMPGGLAYGGSEVLALARMRAAAGRIKMAEEANAARGALRASGLYESGANGARLAAAERGAAEAAGTASKACGGETPGRLSNQTVIGRMKDIGPDKLRPGESTLLKSLEGNLGSPRQNWERNSRVLRQEMSKGNPIRDATVNPETGKLVESSGTFLNLERNLLRNHGWTFDSSTGVWSPP